MYLRTFCASADRQFWPATLSLRDECFGLSVAQGHRQLTDLYLLGLATKMSGVLATFDRSVPLRFGQDSACRHARGDRLYRLTISACGDHLTNVPLRSLPTRDPSDAGSVLTRSGRRRMVPPCRPRLAAQG